MERKLGNFEVINSLIMMSIADIVLTSAGILIKEVNSASLLTSCLISILGIFSSGFKASFQNSNKSFFDFSLPHLQQ